MHSTKGRGMFAVAGLLATAFAAAMTANADADAEFILQDYLPLTSQGDGESEQIQGQLLRSIMQEALAGIHERRGRDTPPITAGDIQPLIQFVNENNSTESAVTGRLFLAVLILNEAEFEDASEALPILRDIQHARPNTWQAALARVHEAAVLAWEVGTTSDQGSEEIREAYKALRRALVSQLPFDAAIDRDKNPTVQLLRSYLCSSDEQSMYLETLAGLATVCEVLGDTDGARDYLHRIQEAAPGTSSARSAIKDIERIDRGEPLLTGLPTGREEPPEELTPAERRERRDEILRKELESQRSGEEDSVIELEKANDTEDGASRRQNAPNTPVSGNGEKDSPNRRKLAWVIIVVGAVCLLGFAATKPWHRE
ncbi:MAG: hypothetical protein ACOX5J_15465 [Candidatus Hydrogenedentales bacterium]